MRSPPPAPVSRSSSQQHIRLETLDTFNDFISSDSSAETASEDHDGFQPPSSGRKLRVTLQNGTARPRLCRAAHFSQQQAQLRKSPRKKILFPGTASIQYEATRRNKSPTTVATAALMTSTCKTTKRTVRRVVRKKSNSSIGSSSSSSSLSSSLTSIDLNEPAATDGSPVVKRGLFLPVRRGRGQSRGGARLSSLQTTTTDKLSDNDTSPLRLSVTARPSTGSRRGGLARRSRGQINCAKVTMGHTSFGDNNEEEWRAERGAQQQNPRRGGRPSGRRGGGRQQRVGKRSLTSSRAEGQQIIHSSSDASSSSENEHTQSGGSRNNFSQLNPPVEEDDLSLFSSSSSTSSSTISDDEEEEEKTEWPCGPSLASLSPHILQQKSRQHRTQMPLHLPSSRRRRKKKSAWTEQRRRPKRQLPKEFDYSNPYETCPVDRMDPYQRKMREAFILYRFLGDYSPVLRSFMHRNLFYLRRKQPPVENFIFPNAQNVFADEVVTHGKFSDGPSASGVHRSSTFHSQNNHHHHYNFAHNQHSATDLARTSSRLSNKFPATIRPSFIRNNLFFGHKKATVQCFHVSDCNGRLSSMRNIPSATFEMKVNERIRNISIDLPDELHADVLSGDKPKSEYLVVRVVFHLEDAEIGGRHLRKVPSRQSSNGASDHQINHQQQQQHCLRKNGPADACDVVMFGAKRIFSYKPSGELKVINDEASIDLFSNSQLHFESNCLKLTAVQLGRLIHGNLKPPDGGSSPFITVHSHGDSDDEDEEEGNEEEEEDHKGNDGKRENLQDSPKMKKLKVTGADGERANVSKEGVSLREALEAMDMAESSGQKMINATMAPSTIRNELLKLPKEIGLKFWLHSPAISRAAPSSMPQLPPGSPPGQQRRRLFFRAAAANANASLAEEQRQRAFVDHWEASSSCSSSKRSSSDFTACFDSSSPITALLCSPSLPTSSSSSLPSSVVSPPFICRRFPSSRCFFCLTSLRVPNLWALQKHLTFCHPRFEFCYETSIRVSPTHCLPGFSISQNIKYDTSNELPSVRTAVRPTWLVTKALAREMRRVDNFPIERYTVVTSKQSTAEDFIRLKGRFNFETPTRIDQLWIRQMSITKLGDITDLHPAECAMMQMWNAFLLRIRVTLLGRRMLYMTLRVFVKYHWRDIDSHHLRTHFLLLLTCLLNTGAIDEEERYDLFRRMEPGYDPCEDSQHIVGREINALRRELNMSTAQHLHQHLAIDGANGSKRERHKLGKLRRCSVDQQLLSVSNGRMKLRHPQQNNNNNDIAATTHITSRLNGSTLKKTAAFAVGLLQQPLRPPSPPPAVSASLSSDGCAHFRSCQALSDCFPFASNKRIALLWKFLQDYDFFGACGGASKQ